MSILYNHLLCWYFSGVFLNVFLIRKYAILCRKGVIKDIIPNNLSTYIITLLLSWITSHIMIYYIVLNTTLIQNILNKYTVNKKYMFIKNKIILYFKGLPLN